MGFLVARSIAELNFPCYTLQDPDSLSVMLLRNVCFFCDSGGPQAIKKCFEEYSHRLSIPLLSHIVHFLSNVIASEGMY